MTHEFLLITMFPLYASRSYHKSAEDLWHEIDRIFDLTEIYYERMQKEFNYKPGEEGEWPGIHVYKLSPRRVDKLTGPPKLPVAPNLSLLPSIEE